MTDDETARELFQIIDKLINLLTIQSTSDFVFEDAPTEGESPCEEYTDCVAGYGLSNTWELEDELVRDPELPDIGDPEE